MTETDVDVESLIESGDVARLREELTLLRPQEIAAVLVALAPDEQVVAFRILPRRLAASVFGSHLSGEARAIVSDGPATCRLLTDVAGRSPFLER